MLDATLPG